MTKIFILTVYMFIFVSIPATAECITGFACSIETLEETQIKQNIKMILMLELIINILEEMMIFVKFLNF